MVLRLACIGDAAQDVASMRSMVEAVLDVAAQAGVTTLAMPLLGAGLAQWPVLAAAKAHVAEVLETAYYKPEGTRLEVSVCDSYHRHQPAQTLEHAMTVQRCLPQHCVLPFEATGLAVGCRMKLSVLVTRNKVGHPSPALLYVTMWRLRRTDDVGPVRFCKHVTHLLVRHVCCGLSLLVISPMV